MEPKKYSAASLLAMCNDRGNSKVKEVLPWHDLNDHGLWLSEPGPLVVGNNRKTMQWHPRMNGNMPALPVPFSAYELAAFFLAGGGVFLRDEFEDGDSLDESALEDLGANAVDERQVLREAHRLYLEASIRFGRTDQGTREAADWLLNHAFDESMAAAEDERTLEPGRTGTQPEPMRADSAVEVVRTVTGVVRNSTRPKRRNILDPVIELAQSKCRDPQDTAQVLAQLEVLAQAEHPPLLASTADGLKYSNYGEDAYLTRAALGKRLSRENHKSRR